MRLFEVLLHPEREEDLSRTEIARAANELQVGEFQFLQLAYHHWHGTDMPEGLIDSLFSQYMLESDVPAWARHYAREVLKAAAQGAIDETDPRFHRYDDDYATPLPTGLRRFLAASFVVVLVIGGGIGFSVFIDSTTTQLLPPYFEEEELRGDDEPAVAPPGRRGEGVRGL
jgi:hypothetical protein